MARPCLGDGSEGIPPRTTTVGLSGRSCDLLPLYTTMLGTGIIECVNRNHITFLTGKFRQDVPISLATWKVSTRYFIYNIFNILIF